MVKKALLVLLVLLVAIQFFRPEKNTSEQLITGNDISAVYPVPDDVHKLFVKKCYDCHSNHTNYPWYYNIQPVGWWLAHHVDEGKGELNFSEFRSYPEKRALHKLEEIGEMTHNGSMPLSSYTALHKGTEITAEDRALIKNWLTSLNVTFSTEEAH